MPTGNSRTVLRNESDSDPIWLIFFFIVCILPYMWACMLGNEASMRDADRLQLRHFPSHDVSHPPVMASQAQVGALANLSGGSYRVLFCFRKLFAIVFHHCWWEGVTPLPLVQSYDDSVKGCCLKLHGYLWTVRPYGKDLERVSTAQN